MLNTQIVQSTRDSVLDSQMSRKVVSMWRLTVHRLLQLTLLLCIHRSFLFTSALLVKRYQTGDIFQNLGSDASYCSQREAQCSILLLEDSTPQSLCSSINNGASCPGCACNEGERFNTVLDKCGKTLSTTDSLTASRVFHYSSTNCTNHVHT